MTSPPIPTFLFSSPATPSELLVHVLSHLRHPTALLICSPRPLFLAALAQDKHPALLHDSLLQRAVSRHIRIAFVPTVSHLRAYLAVFPPADIPAPPAPPTNSTRAKGTGPALLVYGLLEVHREGSEWSAQGIGTTTAALVEAADRSGLRAVVVEPSSRGGGVDGFLLLDERVPLLSGHDDLDLGSVPIRNVLSRWFDWGE